MILVLTSNAPDAKPLRTSLPAKPKAGMAAADRATRTPARNADGLAGNGLNP